MLTNAAATSETTCSSSMPEPAVEDTDPNIARCDASCSLVLYDDATSQIAIGKYPFEKTTAALLASGSGRSAPPNPAARSHERTQFYFRSVTVMTGDSRGLSGCLVISPIGSSVFVDRT